MLDTTKPKFTKVEWVKGGTRAVVIMTYPGGRYSAICYAGVTNAEKPWECEVSRACDTWSGKSKAGARKWAAKKVGN